MPNLFEHFRTKEPSVWSKVRKIFVPLQKLSGNDEENIDNCLGGLRFHDDD